MPLLSLISKRGNHSSKRETWKSRRTYKLPLPVVEQREQSPGLSWRVPNISDLHWSISQPCNPPETDFSWDLFQGPSKESLLQIGSTDSGHSPWPTVGDRLHQQPHGRSVTAESIWVTSTPPLFLLSLFPLLGQAKGSAQAKSRAAAPWGSSGVWGLGRRERTAINHLQASHKTPE